MGTLRAHFLCSGHPVQPVRSWKCDCPHFRVVRNGSRRSSRNPFETIRCQAIESPRRHRRHRRARRAGARRRDSAQQPGGDGVRGARRPLVRAHAARDLSRRAPLRGAGRRDRRESCDADLAAALARRRRHPASPSLPGAPDALRISPDAHGRGSLSDGADVLAVGASLRRQSVGNSARAGAPAVRQEDVAAAHLSRMPRADRHPQHPRRDRRGSRGRAGQPAEALPARRRQLVARDRGGHGPRHRRHRRSLGRAGAGIESTSACIASPTSRRRCAYRRTHSRTGCACSCRRVYSSDSSTRIVRRATSID